MLGRLHVCIQTGADSRLIIMITKPNSMSLKSVSAILSARNRTKIYLFAFARIATNLLDVLGLAGIALLAAAFGTFATSGGGVAKIPVPLLGDIQINETVAVIVAFAVTAIFVLKSAIAILLNLWTSMFIASLESQWSTDLARAYFSGQSEGSAEFSDSLSDFQNIATASTGALAGFINSRIAAISELTLLIAIVSSFLLVNPVVAIAMLFYLISVLWALSRFVTQKIRRNGTNQIEGSRLALTSSRDLFGVRREVRAAGVSDYWIGKFSAGRQLDTSSGAILAALGGLPRYVIETSLITGIFAFLAGIVIFSDLPSQATTIGIFLAGGLRLVASLLPLQVSINNMINNSSQGKLALQRLLSISLDEKQDYSNSLSALDGPVGLEFRKVSFSFDSSKPVIRDVSFSFTAGAKVALVGPSGAGKTTCFELATGLRHPQRGEILLGGKPPNFLLENGNGVIGIVPQRPHLVSGSLLENVSLDTESNTDREQVVRCLEMAGLEHFSTTEELQQDVQPDSGQLSGGEIQRLGLARALYRNPRILFLDEATSALDAKTESGISSVLNGLRGDITIVLIAHRLSTVRDCDRLIYLDGGRVIAEGSFAELKNTVPDFRNAVKLMGLED